MFTRSMVAFALVMSTPAVAKAPEQPPEPTERPDWKAVAKRGVEILLTGYFDPGSAQIEWMRGFTWGYTKPPIGRRHFAWVACGTVNAKNRMGGYTGAQGFSLAIEPTGEITVGYNGQWDSSCSWPAGAPVNPELLAFTGASPASPAASLSIADELHKLAELRDAGVLTAAEFSAQKAKLLGQ